MLGTIRCTGPWTNLRKDTIDRSMKVLNGCLDIIGNIKTVESRRSNFRFATLAKHVFLALEYVHVHVVALTFPTYINFHHCHFLSAAADVFKVRKGRKTPCQACKANEASTPHRRYRRRTSQTSWTSILRCVKLS